MEMCKHNAIRARARITFANVRSAGMNSLEKQYADYLLLQKKGGHILEFRYEKVKLRLADKTWYMPDFFVIMPDGQIEFHEVKGFWRDDARVKIKVAAEQVPEYIFRACTFDTKKKNWNTENF